MSAIAACGAVVNLAVAPVHGEVSGEANDLFFRTPGTGEIVGTGVHRPTAEQWAWGEENLVKTKKVKLNKLGLERVNHARAQRGEPPLGEPEADVAEDGREAAAAGTSGTGGSSTTAALPTYVDNSALPYFPPIRSQGSLNSCAQFSAVYYTLTHMTAMARQWDAKSGGDTYRFSPKWTYNMLNGGGNVGTWHYDAYAVAQKHGLATWAEFPYDGDYRGWCLNSNAWLHATAVRANQAGKVLDVDTDAGLNQLKQLLTDGYVLNFATYINSWQWKALGNDPATTTDDAFAGKNCVIAVNGTSGGHSMTIVGFNDDLWVDLNGNGIVDAGEKGALRIANSWGTGWGEAGFCWVAYQALRTRNAASTSEGLFWYDEATWVTARAAYTPKLVARFTLSHNKRSQLRMSLGVSDVSATAPTTVWNPTRLLWGAGGSYAFNGSTNACDGTFCFDVSDLVPSTTTVKRYYLGLYDTTAGDLAALKSFALLDGVTGTEIPCDVVPLYADASQTYATAAYAAGSGTLADVYAPSVSLLSPASGASVTGLTTVSCSASDNVGIASVTLYVDGVARGTLTAQPYDFVWDSTSVTDGTHTLTVVAADATGNSSQAAATVAVKNALPDTTAPAVTIVSPTAGTKLSGSTITVKVTAKDNVAVTKVALYIDGTLTSTSTTSPFSLTFNAKKLAAGAHTLTCLAGDAAGNLGTSPSVAVTK